MTDTSVERAREAWERWERGGELTLAGYQLADRFIAALERENAELLRAKHCPMRCPICGEEMVPASVLRLIEAERTRVEAALAKAEEERDRLKCCGNCGSRYLHHDPYGECEETCDDPYTWKDDVEAESDWPLGFANVEAHDHCHLNPSRWIEKKPDPANADGKEESHD